MIYYNIVPSIFLSLFKLIDLSIGRRKILYYIMDVNYRPEKNVREDGGEAKT